MKRIQPDHLTHLHPYNRIHGYPQSHMSHTKVNQMGFASIDFGAMGDEALEFGKKKGGELLDAGIDKGKEALVGLAEEHGGEFAGDLARAALNLDKPAPSNIKNLMGRSTKQLPTEYGYRRVSNVGLAVESNPNRPINAVRYFPKFSQVSAKVVGVPEAARVLGVSGDKVGEVSFVSHPRQALQVAAANMIITELSRGGNQSLKDVLANIFKKIPFLTRFTLYPNTSGSSLTVKREDYEVKIRPNELNFEFDGDSPTLDPQINANYYGYINSRKTQIASMLPSNWDRQPLSQEQAKQLVIAIGKRFNICVNVKNDIFKRVGYLPKANEVYIINLSNRVTKESASQLANTPSSFVDDGFVDDGFVDQSSSSTSATSTANNSNDEKAKDDKKEEGETKATSKPFYKTPIGIATIVASIGAIGYFAMKDD